MRYDLAFFLCCCKSFLGPKTDEGTEDFYSLLSLERDATAEDIKRAYKRQSLQMHPDKLAQRGKVVTEEDQARFTRMKEAYEILSDPHKRETYDAIGERGMKWMEEPFSLDPQELAHNFATSSALDRSKIFAIFVGIAVAIFLLPVLVCLQVDGIFGEGASWLAVLTPLWIWDAFILFYHTRVISMGPVARPDHIPPEEWVDPLPMSKRIFSLVRFMLVIVFEILAALRLDEILLWNWAQVFFPIYIWEATTLYKKWPLARMKIVTVEDLETALGKPFADFTDAEKELIARRYSVVPSTTCPEFEAAHKLKSRAKQDIIKLCFRVVFLIFLITQLDTEINWNWWFIFTPFWIMSFCICCVNYQAFAEVQAAAAEKDPEMFGLGKKKDSSNDEENQNLKTGNYGAMGEDGEGTTTAAAAATGGKTELTDEEREELKSQVMASGSRMMSKCCSQAFILLIVCLFVGKIQGAGYASMWVISPLIFVAGIILCVLGCTIFCITEMPDEVEFDTGNPASNSQPVGASAASGVGAKYTPPTMPATQDAAKATPQTTDAPSDSQHAKSTWDPEKGQVWEDPKPDPIVSSPPTTTALSGSSGATSASQPSGTEKVDLLDDAPLANKKTEKPAYEQQSSSIHELD